MLMLTKCSFILGISTIINIYILISSTIFVTTVSAAQIPSSEVVNNQQQQQQEQPEHNKTLEVTIYYETLCGDSIRYFAQELIPTWRKLATKMDLKLVPYGKAIHNRNNETGEWTIDCQHGRHECALNIVHACLLDNLELPIAIQLIACNMGMKRLRGFEPTVQQCADAYQVNVTSVKECSKTNRGVDLFVMHGDHTKSIPLSFVPSIEIDKKFDESEQRSLFVNFEKKFCEKYFNKFNTTCY